MMRQKYVKDKDGNKVPRYYLRAEMVELLPVFSQPTVKSSEAEYD